MVRGGGGGGEGVEVIVEVVVVMQVVVDGLLKEVTVELARGGSSDNMYR